MNTRVQNIVEASRALSPLEKLEVIQELSRNLHEEYAVEALGAEFWKAPFGTDTGRAHSTPVITDIQALAVDFWPSEESADDINKFVSEQRLADSLR